MINFLKNLFKTSEKYVKGAFFNASNYDLKNFLCGIGESEILDSTIKIYKYPFKPSSVYPEKVISAGEIDAICWDAYPPLLELGDEVIFISREYSDDLKRFSERNNIKTFKANSTWNWLLEPYVDTEYTEETDRRYKGFLEEKGISSEEIDQIRSEVKEQMFKYNFDTMLWDWVSLGLADVLAAMRVKYNQEEFANFYRRAMEIQLREKNS